MPGTGSPDSLKLAVDNVVSYYFPSTATRVVCLFHLGHERIARLLDANLERRGRTATLVRTDDSTTSWDALRAEIQGAIAGADLVVNLYFLRYQGGEWMSERIRFLRELIIGERPLVSKEQYLLFKDMDEAAFARIFSVDPLSIDRLNRALISLGNGASQWRLTSGHGTDLSIGVDTARWPLINYNGFSPSDYEMPPGEVLTYPQSIDGHLVLSGILLGTVPIGRKYGCLHEPIVDIEFADGRACAVRSAREELRQDIEFCLSLEEWVCRAG